MIDETVLERALRAEAAAYPPPEDGPDAIRAAAAETAERRPRRLVVGLAAAAASVAVVAAVAAAPHADRTVSASRPDAGGGLNTEFDGDGFHPVNAGRGGRGASELKEGVAQDAANVVRTGEVSVEVRDVPAAMAELTRIATSRRGFVESSGTSGSEGGQSGSVTLRVPTADFDAVVAEAGRLGRVRSSLTSGADVTAEVTDVEARLKSQTAARAQLQALLARAKDVGEVLAVQQRITETQTEIERLQAQQATLRDRTTYGSVHVEVAEKGAYAEGRSGFSKAWHDAVHGFVSAAQGLVGASGTIAFVLVVLALLALALRPVYRALVRRVV
jgi:hypothetical protein